MQPRYPLACVVLVLLACCPGMGNAQSSREAQRKLERIQHELKAVATQRREIAGQRTDASRQLRTADEQLGHSGRALSDTETRLAREQSSLASLQQRRQDLQATLGAQRQELAGLLRDAYTVRPGTPLQLMLAQDRVADASRVLTLHGYLQRDRARRIGLLTTQLRELDTVEAQIVQTRSQLAATKAAQHAQLVQLQRDRVAQARAVAQLDQRYRDRAEREQALTQDARNLQQLLAQLRAAAAREAERKAAAARAARAAATVPGMRTTRRPPPPVIANAAPLRVGGLGWPVSGTLLAGFGATLPDGGTSHGVLIAAPAGTPVKAVADGRVVFADWMNGYGLIVIVDHGNGNMSLYAHNEALLRDVGATIKRGDAVASVGNSGGGSRPGLYFELRRNGQPVNPMGWLQKN
ncbi:peptidoglycan DD-metalloendopeptidase family protein [Cognatiluteimonas profundi]|uniref:murein hydrolase activator EnvC family protein n=1 Tax=Cognatiluteimonas profundi TaxID=2594501 RepID=UPI00131D38FD